MDKSEAGLCSAEATQKRSAIPKGRNNSIERNDQSPLRENLKGENLKPHPSGCGFNRNQHKGFSPKILFIGLKPTCVFDYHHILKDVVLRG